MVKEQNKNTKKVVAVGAVALLATGLVGGFAGAYLFPTTQTVEIPIINQTAVDEAFNLGVASVVIPEAEIEYVNNTVVKYVNNTIEKEVLVDNGNLKLVLDNLYDNSGKVTYLTKGLDDNEVDQIVDRIIFENESKFLAEELVKKEIVEYIDDEEDMFGKNNIEADLREYRDNDVYSVSVDSDDSVFEVSDFDDNEATIYVEAKLKLDNDDDKETIYVIAEVEVEGTDVEIVNVEFK